MAKKTIKVWDIPIISKDEYSQESVIVWTSWDGKESTLSDAIYRAIDTLKSDWQSMALASLDAAGMSPKKEFTTLSSVTTYREISNVVLRIFVKDIDRYQKDAYRVGFVALRKEHPEYIGPK